MRDFIIDIAYRAGQLLKDHFQTSLTIHTKSSEIDVVTEADLQSEALILAAIRANYPDHAILAEESGLSGQSEYVWVVDPLDGTTNFSHQHPHFCVSISLTYQGAPVLATILDPLRDELFVAEKGQGATLNNQPIAVTSVQTLTQVLIVTGFPYNRKTNSHNNLAEFNRIMPTVQGVRRSGSAALDLAYVACGRFDAYWELLVSPWDWMAGALLVQEAGGKITDAAGQILTLDSYSIIAANQELHPQLITLVSDQPPAKNPT